MEKWVQRYEIRYAHDITQKADGTFVTYEAYKQLQTKIEQAETPCPSWNSTDKTCGEAEDYKQLEAKIEQLAKALDPIREWYGSGTEGDRSDLEILTNVIADLQTDRAEILEQITKIEQQQECIRELKELLKTAQCPDILYCHNGFYVNTLNNTKHPCKWCEPRKQAIAAAEELIE